MSKTVFGVDVGGTTVKIGIFSEEGEKLSVWEIQTRTENHGLNILPDIAASIEEKCRENGIAKEDVLGVGIGVPGPVDEEGVVHEAVNLGWGELNIRESLGKLLDLPVAAGNDANVAALGEQWKGAGKGHQDVVVVTLGTGVGGGIIIGGRLVAGATGACGEIGHMHLEDDEPDACNCGNHGCFEEYASATGIVRIAKRILAKSTDATVLDPEKLTSRDIFDAAKAGDAVAQRITEKYGYYLGKGCAIIASVLNPELIVLGGGVSKAGSVILDLLKPSFTEYVFPRVRDTTKFALATLGNDAGMFGSVRLLLQKVGRA